MKVKISDYIADFFVKKGVRHVFGVVGGGAMHLNDAFGHHHDIVCIYNHNEQGSAIGAEVYARLTGRIPVVNVTTGPGGTNALTGVMGAWVDSIPMVVVSGQTKRETTVWSSPLPLRQIGDQEYNIVASVKPMTKYAVMITEPREVKYHLERAWTLCQTGRPGPVWLDVPLDIQSGTIEESEFLTYDPAEDAAARPPRPQPEILQALLDRIRSAKKPLFIAGSGIRLAGARDSFVRLADKLGVPVVTAWNAHDVLWDDHPLFAGRPGTIGTRGGNYVVQNCDLLISMGCRLNVRQIGYNWGDFGKNAYKVMVDIDAAELEKPTLRIDMKIHADVADVIHGLSELTPGIPTDAFSGWRAWTRTVNARYPAVLSRHYANKRAVNPYVFMRALSEILDEDEIIVTGNGSACVISFQSFVIKKGTRLFTNSGCAAMGYGVPAAFGAAVASGGQKRIICLDGDGSIQMNIQELQTIIHHGSNVKIFLLNNGGYLSMKQTQTNLFEPPFAGVNSESGVSFPDMRKIAEAYGFAYFQIDTNDDVSAVAARAIAAPGPVMCQVMLDADQIFEPKISSKILEDGTIVSPSIDDMFPFLPKEEHESNRYSYESST